MIPLEIERKFLIEQTPSLWQNCSEEIGIVQIYLKRDDPGTQRRVRSWKTGGAEKYFYTEKRFISAAVREENEREISREDFLRLKNEADPSLVPIEKTRLIIPFQGQRFEADVYAFEKRLATMELELSSEDQEIRLPPFVKVIREVTGEKAYSNAVLAASGFPAEG